MLFFALFLPMFTPAVAQFLQETVIPLRLSCLTPSGWPMVLSLWYLHENGRFYCATSQKAKVARYLRQNNRCAFEVAGDQPPYKGVRGQAIATLDPQRGPEILARLLQRYLGGTDSPLAQQLLARQEQEVAIILEPTNHFTWDFTARMRDSLPQTTATSIN